MRQENEQSIWDEAQAKAYALNRHGVDGRRFLDQHIYEYLTAGELSEQDLLDIGCGTGPWSAYALENGARTVTGFDANKAMTDQARILLQKGGVLPPNVRIEEHDANNMPADWTEKFSRLLSINVGCNLADLRKHFAEAHRVAIAGATMLVTAPNSLTTVFTDGEADGIAELLAEWERLGIDQRNPATAKRMIWELSHVHRATFRLLESNALELVTTDLPAGTPVIRRIPGLAVDNNIQRPDAYISAAEAARWKIADMHESKFADEEERTIFNASSAVKLGKQYVKDAPFLTMKLLKL